jgi:hypothetical protein
MIIAEIGNPENWNAWPGQAVSVNCLWNVQEFRVGVATYAIVAITFVRATNRCYGYVKLMHLTSQMGREKFLDVGCYLMWPDINARLVVHVDEIRRAFGPWSVS